MQIPLIILHGWGASSRSFDKVKSLLTQKGFLVYALDLPGFGEANLPPRPWEINNYVDYVLHYLEVQQIDKYYIYGHSFGGRIAIKLASRQPAGLKGLILCDAAGVTPRPKIKLAVWKFATKIGKIIFSWPILKNFRNLVRKIEYRLAGTKDYYYLQAEVMKETFNKVIKEDLTRYLPSINTKTLIIWGEKDRLTPISDAYLMDKNIGNSRLEILRNTGHSPHLEAPVQTAKLVAEFVNQ